VLEPPSDPVLVPRRLLLFSQVHGPSVIVGEPHQHPQHEVVFLTRGRYQSIVEDRRLSARAGSVITYPRGLIHTPVLASSDARLLVVSFAGPDGDVQALPRQASDHAGHVGHLLERLWRLVHYGPCAADIPHVLIRLLIHEIAATGDHASGPVVTVVQDWIRDDLHRPVSLDLLARAAGLSRYHFLRRFTQSTGLTPMAYIRKARVDRACQLLTWTDLPLKAIATQVGVRSPFHLSHLITTATGSSPSAVRRRQRAGA
jgi:AraC-like DNA-binding protein/quercetin dioxygenase-like cupin family protein